MKLSRFVGALAAVASATLLASAPVRAADDFPTRPITMVVGYEAGGPTDLIARVMAKSMTKILHENVIVENKPGASAHIAAMDVMHSPPDGYRVLVTSLTLNVNPLLYPKRYDYDSVKAFAPVSNWNTAPMVLVVNYNSPFKSVADIVKAAKANPGTLTFASSGIGGSAHLAGEVLSVDAGLKMTHVPFKGNGPALQEVLANRISFMFYPSVGIANYVANKQLRVLAVGSKNPLPDFPGVPTMDSLGFANFDNSAPWVGMLAPAGTPQAVVDKLNQASNEAMQDPEVKKAFAQFGVLVNGGSPDDFRQFLIQDRARWADVISKGHVETSK